MLHASIVTTLSQRVDAGHHFHTVGLARQKLEALSAIRANVATTQIANDFLTPSDSAHYMVPANFHNVHIHTRGCFPAVMMLRTHLDNRVLWHQGRLFTRSNSTPTSPNHIQR